jgi:hypothetical protein
MRVEDNSQSYPYFRMGLFLLAIIAVAGISSAYQPGQSSRALMAVPNSESDQTDQVLGSSTDTLRKMEEKSRSNDGEDKNRTAVVKMEDV